MKKIYAAAFMILIIPFLFPLMVKASNYDTEWLKTKIYEITGYTVTNTSQNNSTLQSVLSSWESSGDDLIICKLQNGNIVCASSYENISFSSTYPYTIRIYTPCGWGLFATDNTSAFKVDEINTYWDGLHGQNLGAYVNIDFSNVTYMPSLPTPKPRVNYVSSWNPVTLINNVINPVIPYQLTYDAATAITGMMYVETYIKFSRPTLINVSLSGAIDTYHEVWSDPIYINTMESQTLLSDLSSVTTPYILDLQNYNQDWEDFKDSVSVTYTFDDNVPTALRQTYQDVFENKFNCAGLGGNNFSLYQRYFIIDSNYNVYCGDWFVWNSGRVSKVKSDDVNKDFKPGEEPSGTINVVQPDYVNDTSDNYAPSSGTSTGNDVLTIVNNLVPNYPDYPTAVSYNHDHVLTQFIQTSKQLPGFMGSFGDFLKACFGFIDESVWAVIATGFSCCIVIMIIKVL